MKKITITLFTLLLVFSFSTAQELTGEQIAMVDPEVDQVSGRELVPRVDDLLLGALRELGGQVVGQNGEDLTVVVGALVGTPGDRLERVARSRVRIEGVPVGIANVEVKVRDSGVPRAPDEPQVLPGRDRFPDPLRCQGPGLHVRYQARVPSA